MNKLIVEFCEIPGFDGYFKKYEPQKRELR